MSCNHVAHNWNVVYQCRGCNEIVPEEIAEGHLAQLEAKLESMACGVCGKNMLECECDA